jgi:hypothetical protein
MPFRKFSEMTKGKQVGIWQNIKNKDYRASCKMIFSPNLFVMLKFYPRNINYMPAVKFFACLDLERKSSFCKRLYRF